MIVLIISALSACAQGEWKWAHYWTGSGGSYESYYNQITNTAFDDEGNIYVYGTMGGNPKFDGNTLQFTTNAQVLSKNNQSILLAKFDTLGNMLWYKVVKSNGNPATPRWMEIRDNKIHISGDMEMEYVDYNWNNIWLYYLDTLIRAYQVHEIPIEERHPPYMTGYWTFITTLNTDGELLQDHFVETHSREILINGYRMISPLSNAAGIGYAPIHVDAQGNTYIYTPIHYRGYAEDPLTIVIDGDTSKTYNIYLPGNVDSNLVNAYMNNAMLFIFSPEWELISSKLLIDHTDGIVSNNDNYGDGINSFYCNYSGISFDEDDNMYLTGYIQLGNFLSEYGGDLHNYPVHIWWDSIHYATINDITSAEYCNFIIKYDKNGNILWNNQIYTKGEKLCAKCEWMNNVFNDNHIYILGSGSYTDESIIYFDNENNSLQRFQNSYSDICFFVRYNSESGEYNNQGIVPSLNALSSKYPAVVNNYVLALSEYNSDTMLGLTQWRVDGTHINTYTIQCPNSQINIMRSVGAYCNNTDYLLVSLSGKSPVFFSNNVSVNCSTVNSNAVFALYNDPNLSKPIGIPTYTKQEQDIKIWPNPANNILNIENTETPIDYISISDLNGKTLFIENVKDYGTMVDVSRLPAGTYLLETVCKGQVFVEKFVKTN